MNFLHSQLLLKIAMFLNFGPVCYAIHFDQGENVYILTWAVLYIFVVMNKKKIEHHPFIGLVNAHCYLTVMWQVTGFVFQNKWMWSCLVPGNFFFCLTGAAFGIFFSFKMRACVRAERSRPLYPHDLRAVHLRTARKAEYAKIVSSYQLQASRGKSRADLRHLEKRIKKLHKLLRSRIPLDLATIYQVSLHSPCSGSNHWIF